MLFVPVQKFRLYGLMVGAQLSVEDPRIQPDQVRPMDGLTVWEWRAAYGFVDNSPDRIGAQPTFLLFQFGAVVMVFLYSRITERARFSGGSHHGRVCEWMNGAIGALISEAYPLCRATAQTRFGTWSRSWSLGPLAVGHRARIPSRSDRAPRFDLFPGYRRDSILDPELKVRHSNMNDGEHPDTQYVVYHYFHDLQCRPCSSMPLKVLKTR